jgi:hypothetical protein
MPVANYDDVIPHRSEGAVRNLRFATPPDQRDKQVPHRRFAPIRNDIKYG